MDIISRRPKGREKTTSIFPTFKAFSIGPQGIFQLVFQLDLILSMGHLDQKILCHEGSRKPLNMLTWLYICILYRIRQRSYRSCKKASRFSKSSKVRGLCGTSGHRSCSTPTRHVGLLVGNGTRAASAVDTYFIGSEEELNLTVFRFQEENHNDIDWTLFRETYHQATKRRNLFEISSRMRVTIFIVGE